jgi:hypothetical protein
MLRFFALIKSYLVRWYRWWRHSRSGKIAQVDPLLALYGTGKELWSDEHADEYVARLRKGWE